MKILLSTFVLSLALASGALAQTTPGLPIGGLDSIGHKVLSADLKALFEGMDAKIAAAREAARAARADIEALKAAGKTPEEIKAMLAEHRAAALLNLQKALDALDGLPDGTKDRVTKAIDVVSKRLEERKKDVTP